jgi:hypothetical protein
MLTLVLGDSLPLLFVGWEGVGMCSYLLIGFWYDDPQKAYAGRKAFITNRIGDFGFLRGQLRVGARWSKSAIADAGRRLDRSSARPGLEGTSVLARRLPARCLKARRARWLGQRCVEETAQGRSPDLLDEHDPSPDRSRASTFATGC